MSGECVVVFAKQHALMLCLACVDPSPTNPLTAAAIEESKSSTPQATLRASTLSPTALLPTSTSGPDSSERRTKGDDQNTLTLSDLRVQTVGTMEKSTKAESTPSHQASNSSVLASLFNQTRVHRSG
eukprot:m.89842 g.89842  ORF g.89842 m.89842 type:complete len:127 (+) comp51065_c0_seq2:978-1358(+)